MNKPKTYGNLREKNVKRDIVFKEAIIKFYSDRNCVEESFIVDFVDDGSNNAFNICGKHAKSAIIIANNNDRIIDLFDSCTDQKEKHYSASIYPLDKCVNIYHYPQVSSVKFVDSNLRNTQISSKTLRQQYLAQDIKPLHDISKPAKSRIIFSCESSEYFGYQVWANYFGFLTSKQTSTSWTRLLTGIETDDLTDYIPGLATFQTKRHLFSGRYSPINKADVIEKWFASKDSPKEDILIVIDPDNWLLKDVEPWTKKVSKGYAVGEAAYYYGSNTAQLLWKELCEHNCALELDLVGVPYVVYRDDLEAIAPLWKYYSILIKETLEKDNPKREAFEKKFK